MPPKILTTEQMQQMKAQQKPPAVLTNEQMLQAKQQPAAPQKSFLQKAGGVLDTVFGGAKIGEAIGTQIAKGNLGTGIQKFVTGRDISPEEEQLVSAGPTRGEIVGDVGRVALNFTPIGRMSGALGTRLAQEGMKRGAKTLGNVATGAATGYGFDVAEGVRQGEENPYAPGIGTAIGGAIPVAGPVLKAAGGLAGKSAAFGTSQMTGLNRNTVSQILETPEAFSRNAMQGMNREKVLSDVVGTLKKEKEGLSQTGKLYEPLRQGGTVKVPRDITASILDKYGLKLKNGKVQMTAESRPISQGDAKALEGFLSQYGKSLRMSNNAYFNAKEALSQLSRYESGTTKTAQRMFRDLRAAYEKVGDEQVSGLKALDEKYAPQKREVSALLKDYLDKNGNVKDRATTMLANLTNKGRERVLARLEKAKPGIGKQIKVLRAIEDIENASGLKIGTYQRAIVVGGQAATGNIPSALITMILSQPEIAVPLLRRFGIAKNQMGKVAQILRQKLAEQTAQGISPGDRLLNTEAGKRLESHVTNSIKNPSFGLSIKPMSQDDINFFEKFSFKKNPTLREVKIAEDTMRFYGMEVPKTIKGKQDQARLLVEAQINTDMQRAMNNPYGKKGEGVTPKNYPNTGKLGGSTKKVTNDNSLVAVHNLNEANLRFADRVGGLANPSLAVIDPRLTAFESYGDITLLADKELLRGQKTHLSDAYSARFPSVHSTMDFDNYQRLENELAPYYKKIGEDARKLSRDDTNMIREIENNPAVALRFLEEKGVPPTNKGQYYFYSQIREQGLENDFQDFLDGLYKKFNLKEQMFAGYTNMGRRRYKDVDLAEASKMMKKQKDEGFDYGLGSYRSKVAPVKTTPEAIKKEAGRLLTKEQFEKVKETYDKELWDLKDELEPYAKKYDSNQFIEADYQIGAIGGVITGEDRGAVFFKTKYPDAPPELLQKVYQFRDKLKNMPTEYFETKFKRPVGIDEFKVAIVPEKLPLKAQEILRKKGLEIIKYKEGEKSKTMKGLLNRPEAFAALPFIPLMNNKVKEDQPINVTR